MLSEFLQADDLLLQKDCRDWQDALDTGAAPLLARQVIEPSYVEDVKENHRKNPYMVVAPGIMLAHARPESGAHSIGLTLLTLERPLAFGNERNDPVSLVITLATPDDTSHVKMLEALMGFLTDQGRVEGLLGAKSYEDALKFLSQ